MLVKKWKDILTNWITCYFNNSTNLQIVNLESLLGVIKHLHENFSLDESKSSILEARTLEEFLTEKYPAFLFENGSVEAGSEDEVYILASLLFFFVCVNSKDTDIKNALCTKLNGEQQEIILKFNKCLMKCPVIMYRDVEAAIKEACKQDDNSMEQQTAVAETPPALRSFHSEVQRLRASLDAERFDRNYLQDELARTNLTLEKLSKEKDEYKQEVTMLRAKISSCRIEEAEAQTHVGAADLASSKLMRQLEELQTRFMDAQAQLEDMQHERDTYKTKVEELRVERDKWITFGQQESDRAAQLAHQLDSECRNVESLRELVAELRQHHKRNGLDTSQLECDDPDISVRSLTHNLSTCNEVCANVVEVQLEEERARITELTQLSQALQNQISSLEETACTEKAAFDGALSEKDVEIQNLKHQIKTEVGERIKQTEHNNDEMSKLNNEINELEQKMNNILQSSSREIKKKMSEIQKLQEEKLTLVQSFSSEITKLENVIKDNDTTINNLRMSLDTTENSRLKLKDDYDNHILKLNDKLLNRNNELVELQNSMLQRSDEIENITRHWQNQKKLHEDLESEYIAYIAHSKENLAKLETDICMKEEIIQQLDSQVIEKSTIIDNNAKELIDIKHTIEKLREDLQLLNDTHTKLQDELKDVISQRDLLQSELDYLSNAFADEKYDLEMSLHQKDASLAVMALDLEQEVNLTKDLQSEISELKHSLLTRTQELEEKIRNLDELTIKYDTINKELADVVSSKDNLHQTIMLMNTEIKEQIRSLTVKDEVMLINDLKNSETGPSEISVNVLDLPVQEVCARIAEFTQFTNSLQEKMKSLRETTSAEKAILNEKLSKRDSEIKSLKDQISTEIEEKVKLTELNNSALSKLNLKVNELEQKISHMREKTDNDIELKAKKILKLQEEKSAVTAQLEYLKNTVLDKQQQLETVIHEQDTCKAKLEELRAERDKWATLSQKDSDHVVQLTHQLEEEHRSANVLRELVAEKNRQNVAQDKVCTNLEEQLEKERMSVVELTQRSQTLQDQMKSIKEKSQKEKTTLERALSKRKADIERLKLQISAKIEEKKTLTELNKDEINTLNNKMNEMEQKTNDRLKNSVCDIENKMKSIQKLQEENSKLTKKMENLEENLLDKQAQLEICANVKTELERERVYVIELTQLSQSLKDQLNTLGEISSIEKATLEQALSESNTEIANLKCNISVETKENMKLKEYNINEIIKLNNQKSELELKINFILQEFSCAIQNKTDEVQKLQEEKSILTVKLDNFEKDLFDRQLQLEACSNLEEQLKEERMHIAELTQLLHTQQDQLKSLEQSSSADNTTFMKTLSVKNAEIESLKVKISTEIEKNLMLNERNKNEICTLNNKINELELTIKEVLENSTNDRENNTKEVLILQEEKSMLMVQLEDLEKIISDRQEQLKSYGNLKEQLEEERTHVVELTLLSQALQSQLKSQEMKASTEKTILETALSESNAEIKNLKQQVTAETEDKINVVERNMDEISMLNNKINELEQKIKDNLECSTYDTEIKMKKIQELYEEKATLTVEIEELKKSLLDREVQLGVFANLEEKFEGGCARIIELTQLSQTLQDKLEQMENTYSVEKATLEKSLCERNSEIETLRHNMNEEIEEKVKLIEHSNNLILKLTNETLVLEKKIENILKQSISDLENKTMEINELQEEKFALLQNISDNIWKFQTIIKNQDTVIDDYEKKQDIMLCNKVGGQTHVEAAKLLSINVTEQLGRFEMRLLDRKSQCEELQHELDAYKIKMEELKAERDKWIAIGQQQSDQAAQLANQLELEHRNVESLKKLVEEKNSQHSNAYANLEEHVNEKNAHISELSQLSQALQGQIELVKTMASSERATLETALSERTAELETVKHQMKIEEEEKIKMTQYNSIQTDELNIKINELEQKVNDITNKNLSDIKDKIKVIQKLEDEKSTLIQVITEEITKLEILIKNINSTTPNKFTDANKPEKMLCSEESETLIPVGAAELVSLGFTKQLKGLEEILLARHAQIEKDHLELDMYKSKVEELKEEREKLLEFHQQECNRVSQLTDELNATLHSRENIAAQLEQERTRVVELTQLYQALQNQMKSLEDTSSREKETLDKALSERSVEIECLKHQINEIKENKLNENNNVEMSQLNSDQSVLEHKIDDSVNHTISNVENKNKEIQKLQEEKSTLIQSFSNEITKLESIIKDHELAIYDLKRQLSKRSVTETRANQIIKVSAKYQAIILKRIAEIKTQKEAPNFNCDNDLRKSLNAGAITMDELEKFLETTDKHLRRCIDKQTLLQKEKDTLAEMFSSKESEMINVKKFLTELCLYIKTFTSVKETYAQKLSRVISIQRTVRREMHNLEGHLSDSVSCKLERDYTTIMQDLTECAMNMERWAGKSVEMAVSPDKIKQAFKTEISISPGCLQNTGLELQFDDLESSFQKFLEEISLAKAVEPVESEANTIMKVRAEYEDKLDRMKQKMKQLYQEQIGIFRERQKEEIASLERELAKANERLAESSRAYEEHIRGLTTELWSVGEKFLMKKDEAEWLRKKQRSGSLMSLQQTHSSGMTSAAEEKFRPSDTFSLRSLPVHSKKTERRGLHMSDEEGEVFDNRYLRELRTPPTGTTSVPPDMRLSELRWRNSLCPPHLKSSYPAETQFAPTVIDEDDIKSMNGCGSRRQRKEVGITAYKKPGPPTPSKQAGRLSATDSELRESLRPEPESQLPRKTSTPSRIRALFRSHKNDADNSSTPRSKRLSIFRSKK